MKRKFTYQLVTLVTLIVISIMMLVQTDKRLETVTNQIIEINTEDRENLNSFLTPVRSQIVELQNIEPVVNPYYNIPLSDSDQLLIQEIAGQFGIDNELFLAIIKTESQFDINSIGDNGKSLGLLQIQPKYWTDLFDVNNCNDWFSVRDNITTGCAILQYLYASYGDTLKVLNGYNSSDPNNYNRYSDEVLMNLEEIHNLKR